jgi:hypothetical protein
MSVNELLLTHFTVWRRRKPEFCKEPVSESTDDSTTSHKRSEQTGISYSDLAGVYSPQRCEGDDDERCKYDNDGFDRHTSNLIPRKLEDVPKYTDHGSVKYDDFDSNQNACDPSHDVTDGLQRSPY